MLPRPGLPRRTAIALGVAGLVAVAGCDDGADPPPSPPTPSPDADQALVDEVVSEITAVWRLTGARPELAALHEAHVAALDAEITVDPARRQVPASALRKREQRLHARLVDAAVAAESGELARLLASMSAAVGQRVAAL